MTGKSTAAETAGRHAGVFDSPPVETPTNHFPDGPLMGNGDMTAVLGGRADLQTFWIGKSDFWTDGAGWESTNEEYSHYVVSPICVGGVRLWFRDFACGSYRVEQRIAEGEVSGIFESQGICIKTNAFVDANSNLLVIAIENEGRADLGIQVRTFARGNDDPAHSYLPVCSGVAEDGTAWASRETWDRGRWVSRACLAVRVTGAEAESRESGPGAVTTAFLLKSGTRVYVAAGLRGGWNASGHVEAALESVRGIYGGELERIRERHRGWWRKYWERCWIDIGGGADERFWYGAYYAMACCSRDGATAPGIFGFPTDDHPRWSGDYHLNYNFEQPFQALASGNRAEWMRPYIDAVVAFMDEGKRRAAEDLDPPMSGVYYPIGLGPNGQVAQDSYMSQKCAAVYAAWLFDEYFRYTRDKDYAASKLYPFLRETGRFWESYLREENGRFVIRGSASHEHGGNDFNASFDLPLVRRLFRALIEMSEAIGADAGKRAVWEDISERLAGYPTAEYEGKIVFKEAENAPGFTRSLSLLNIMWPGCGDAGIAGDPDLRRTAGNTLEALGSLGLWEQGNVFQWMFPAAVRTGMTGVRERLLRRLESPVSGLRRNLTLAQAYGGIETCGCAAAVNEMLLQSYEGIIRLFPLWPRECDAEFHNMLAYGAIEVSARMRGGVVEEVSLHAAESGSVTVDASGLAPGMSFTDSSGIGTAVFQSGGVFSFCVVKGVTYTGKVRV